MAAPAFHVIIRFGTVVGGVGRKGGRGAGRSPEHAEGRNDGHDVDMDNWARDQKGVKTAQDNWEDGGAGVAPGITQRGRWEE